MTLLIVAGDPSGDLHASHLISALRKRDEHLHIAAVGGPLMKAVAHEFIEDLASRGVTGFWEPLVKLPFLFKLGARIRAFLAERKPSAVICVDYYGFNRRVLGLARDAGLPAFYYISPQVWASRRGRVDVLKPSSGSIPTRAWHASSWGIRFLM
jgi:lipid-A-disaccharide synthase